jgi:hypothetical protein
MYLSLKNIIYILIVIVFGLLLYINLSKNNELAQFNCPNNCKRESKNDTLCNMCYESCEDIYDRCPTTCNIVCECDPTGTCLPKCKKKCKKELKICKSKCDKMTPTYAKISKSTIGIS